MQPVGLIVIAGHLDIIHSRLHIKTVKRYRVGHIGLFQPGFFFDPRIRHFFLKMIVKFLLEKSQMIVKSDAVTGKSQGSDRIQEAGCQPAQAALSQ